MADMRDRRMPPAAARQIRACQTRMGRGCECKREQSVETVGCRRLKKRLQEIDFAIVDTVLYLDAYPDCEMALAYYHKLCEERAKCLMQVNEACGPTCATQNESREQWKWVQGPWPWQSEAN